MQNRHARSFTVALIFGIVMAFGLAGCGGGSSSTVTPINGGFTGTLAGVVTRIPTSTTSTTTPPVSGATIQIQTIGTGITVASGTTNSSGNYSIIVAPGNYTVVPQPTTTLIPIVASVTVNVKLNQTTTANFSYGPPGS